MSGHILILFVSVLVAVSAVLSALGFKGRVEVIGVDLGTTYSVAAVSEKGRVRVFEDPVRGKLTASTVAQNEYRYIADIELQLHDLPLVQCNLGDLNQVFLNIIVNASHAIASANEGTEKRGLITVRTEREGDGWVKIAISDTGTGIPPEAQKRIFEPFFTTKEVGKGTGQGLAIAHSMIVEKHKGSLDFETAEGRGTTFIIRLPVEGIESTIQPAAH